MYSYLGSFLLYPVVVVVLNLFLLNSNRMIAKGPVRAESTVSEGRPRELRGVPSDGTERGHNGAHR